MRWFEVITHVVTANPEKNLIAIM